MALEDVTPPSLLERPGQVVQSLLADDMDGAWRAALSPESLTLHQQQALLRQMGIGVDSPKARLLKAVTNPAFLVSLLLTYKFPIPSPRALAKAASAIDGAIARIPILRSFASPRAAFKDTVIPDLMDELISHKNTIYDRYMVQKLGPAFHRFESAVGRPINAREQTAVFAWAERLHEKPLPGWEKEVGVLVPNLSKVMSPAMKRLAAEVRSTMDDAKTFVWSDPANKKALLTTIRRMKAMGFEDPDLGALASLLKKDGYAGLPDYMPHRVVRTQADVQRLKDAVAATMSNKEFARSGLYKTNTILGREFYKRAGSMVPAFQDLMVLGDAVDPKAYIRLQNAVKDKLTAALGKAGVSSSATGKLSRLSLDEIVTKGKNVLDSGDRDKFVRVIAEDFPAQYSMKLEPVLQSYFNSIGSTYAWSIKNVGPRVLEEAARMRSLGKLDARAAWRSHVLENTLVPAMLGRPTPRQAINAQLWDQRIGSMLAHLDRPSVKAVLGEKFPERMKTFFQESHGAFSLKHAMHSAASYFYLSTLGANPAAAFNNNFQSILTTGPAIGFGNAVAGQLKAWDKAQDYFKLRMGQRLGHAEALRQAFPEFTAAGLSASPVSDEALGRAFESAFRIHRTAPAGVSLLQKASTAAMAMFSASETSVRLGAFYGALRQAGKAGLRGAEATKHAYQTVVRTQFVPTLTDQPIVFGPAGALANPLLRQMAQFPTKMLEFTIDGLERAIRGDPSQIARQFAGSYIAMEIGDVLGINVGDVLIGGALPAFTNIEERGQVLAPLPVVPPAFAIGGAVASSLSSGDWESVHRQLPLLVPGGVGLARTVGFLPDPTGSDLPQKAAHWLNRKYANYNETTPSGRVPVYSGKDNLLGFYRPWEIVKYNLGIRGGDIDAEAQLSRRLQKDADQIKATRQRYIQALFRNDIREAMNIKDEYQSRFGHELMVDERTITQMHERRKMTRIERQLATMPKSARIEYEAELFREGEGGDEPYRSPARRSVTPESPVYTNQMGVLGEIDPYSIGKLRTTPNSFP